MSYQPGEVVKRVQKVLENLEEKAQELARIEADKRSMEIRLNEARKSLDQTRRQLLAELSKLDPQTFLAYEERLAKRSDKAPAELVAKLE